MTSSSPQPPFDYETLLDEVGGHEAAVRDLLGVLMQSTADSARRIREAVASRDCPGVATAAHKIKGALITFGAQPAAEVAAALEENGRRCDLDAVVSAVVALDEELERLRTAVAAIRDGGETG